MTFVFLLAVAVVILIGMTARTRKPDKRRHRDEAIILADNADPRSEDVVREPDFEAGGGDFGGGGASGDWGDGGRSGDGSGDGGD